MPGVSLQRGLNMFKDLSQHKLRCLGLLINSIDTIWGFAFFISHFECVARLLHSSHNYYVSGYIINIT